MLKRMPKQVGNQLGRIEMKIPITNIMIRMEIQQEELVNHLIKFMAILKLIQFGMNG